MTIWSFEQYRWVTISILRKGTGITYPGRVIVIQISEIGLDGGYKSATQDVVIRSAADFTYHVTKACLEACSLGLA